MNDLSDLLPRAAGDEVPVGFDHTDVRRRLRHRTRQRRALALASIVAVILAGTAIVALAGQGTDRDEGVYARDGTDPVTAEELTSGPWLLVAVSRVTVIDSSASLSFKPDGTLLLFDGDACGSRIGRWELDGGHLRIDDLVSPVDEEWAREADLPACPPDTVLVTVLAANPTAGRPDPGLGSLALRASNEFAFFERFDRMGRIPTEADVAGPWTIDGGVDGWTVAFHADGVVEGDDEGCPLRRSWSMDGDRLVIADDGDDPRTGGLCEPVRISDHDLFDGATRVRLGGMLPWDHRLLLDVDGIVVAFERPASDRPASDTAPQTSPPG